MAETLSSSDRELNFLQFGDYSHSSSSSNEINLSGFNSEMVQNTNLEFQINLSNPDFNCGDLYITIYDMTSGKQVLTQSGYLKQCYLQNNYTLPVDESYSELISKSGTYEIHIEIFNQKYSDSITTTELLRVK